MSVNKLQMLTVHVQIFSLVFTFEYLQFVYLLEEKNCRCSLVLIAFLKASKVESRSTTATCLPFRIHPIGTNWDLH